MLPTQLLLHLRLPRVRGVVETLTLLPLVFPPVVLVVGVSDTFAWVGDNKGGLSSFVTYIRGSGHPLVLALLYVTLAMPFVFRTIDAGIRSIDARTLVEAARDLGAGWLTVLFRVLMPPLRTAIVNAAFLCFALVMGEYTISSILLYTKPFPVWLYQLPTTSGSGAGRRLGVQLAAGRGSVVDDRCPQLAPWHPEARLTHVRGYFDRPIGRRAIGHHRGVPRRPPRLRGDVGARRAEPADRAGRTACAARPVGLWQDNGAAPAGRI